MYQSYIILRYVSVDSSWRVTNGNPIPIFVDCWTLLQVKVLNGSTSFNQSWNTYKFGFGSTRLDDNFWVGNNKLHQLTATTSYRLRIEVFTDVKPKPHLHSLFAIKKHCNVGKQDGH